LWPYSLGKERFNLIQYNKWNNIIEKNVNIYHSIIANIFEKEANIPLKWEVEKQPTQKKSNPFDNAMVNFFLPNIFCRRIICGILNCFLKIWTCWLLKIIYPCNLWKVCGWNAYVCICVQDFSFFLESSFHKRCYLNSWKRLNSCMFYQLWHNVIL
jgi:hypothetical protein